ncbi:hypothetical protein T01_5713 [Trichinella spiralis]|uniref:Uncharacterized protein n=1 Tax=Trichinella spiralis TaxID=6334 RepID=A0A0V1AYD4_TRISP|nr:hypothetical protein T01_5713 [Trichinella spiralis]
MISGFNAVEPTPFNTSNRNTRFLFGAKLWYSGIHQKPTANLVAVAASAVAFGARSPSFCASMLQIWSSK